jgi:hypothetical protein
MEIITVKLFANGLMVTEFLMKKIFFNKSAR